MRMGIDESNPIWKQIYWIDESRCLRPMLAPNLYTLLEILQKFIRPLKIFEVGTCFRRESKGKIHTQIGEQESGPQEKADRQGGARGKPQAGREKAGGEKKAG